MTFCFHRRYTWPLTLRRPDGSRMQTYVCCLECGRRGAYDMEAMKPDWTQKQVEQEPIIHMTEFWRLS